MFANPLTLIILLLFLLFICAALLIWFALTVRMPNVVSPSKPRTRKRAKTGIPDAVQVKEGKHRSSRARTEPAAGLRGSAALMEDAQAKSLAKVEAERAARLEALKAERAANPEPKPAPKSSASAQPAPRPAPNPAPAPPAASTPQRAAPPPQRKPVQDVGEPKLERAKRESPFPSPPRYDPNQGGSPMRVRPVAKNPTAKPEPTPNEPAKKPAPEDPKPKPQQRTRKPDAFEQFIRSKNDEFDL